MFTLSIGKAIFGAGELLINELFMGAAWVINLTVAEYVIRRTARRPARPSS